MTALSCDGNLNRHSESLNNPWLVHNNKNDHENHNHVNKIKLMSRESTSH